MIRSVVFSQKEVVILRSLSMRCGIQVECKFGLLRASYITHSRGSLREEFSSVLDKPLGFSYP